MDNFYYEDNDSAMSCDYEEDYTNDEEDYTNAIGRPRHYYGGNSGYVNYSKSKRAVEAEANGLRNKSQMDASFAKEVNDLIQQVVPGAKRVTLKQIKRALDEIEPDEWHHTSMYGNRTNYYSAETIAEYLRPETDKERQDREEYENLRNEYYNLKSYIQDYIFDAIPKVDVQVSEYGFVRHFYKTSEGWLIEVHRNVWDKIEGDMANHFIPAGLPAEAGFITCWYDDYIDNFLKYMSDTGDDDYKGAYKNLMRAQREVDELISEIKSTYLTEAIAKMELLQKDIKNFWRQK